MAQRQPGPMTPEFEKSFEHFILMELKAFQAYRNPELLLSYWRTSAGQEVDFTLGDMEVAIEIKSSKRVYESDIKGLKALAEAHRVKRLILISFQAEPKTLSSQVECLPWENFLNLLWSGEII